MDKTLDVSTIMPFIYEDGVGVQIYAAQQLVIPEGVYHRDGISGTEHWRAAIAAILHLMGIHSDAVRYEFDGNVIYVTVPNENVCVAKFRKVITASSRFIFGETEGERTASAA